jgi:hypothetical protein
MRGMDGYPIKYRDNSWQVRVLGDQWLCVDSESDAQIMSGSLDLMHRVAEGDLVGEDIARKLESVASLFQKYGCDTKANWIIEHAKFARGLPSAKLS